MGFRYIYSTTNKLVLNTKTKRIFPYFHMVFDDGFTSDHKKLKALHLIWDRLIILESIKVQKSFEDKYCDLAYECDRV